MSPEYLQGLITTYSQQIIGVLTNPETYIQLSIILTGYAAAYFIANRMRRHFSFLGETPDPTSATPNSLI
jgi:hypothetical protein